MKKLVFCLLGITGIMLGCAQNHFNIPAENFAEKVKVLGVAPIFIDADSDINHPQKELLVPLISDLNRKYEALLVSKLQSTGNYYAVTLLADPAAQLFSSLLARREKRDDAGIQYNKYFFKNDEIGSYLKKNRLDAVMVVVVSGLSRTSKIYSSNLLLSLETNYNFLVMSAQILGSDGAVLWEYPNFRGRMLPYYPLVNLQYPDFSESEANISNRTEVRFKSIDGIRRTLEQKKSDVLFRETKEPEVYGRIFDEMVSLVKHSVENQPKGRAAAENSPAVVTGTVPKTGVVSEQPAPSPLPKTNHPVTAPAQSSPPAGAVELPAGSAAPYEVVPSTGNSR